jgi:archaellin
MIRISVRDKIILELYTSISLFSAIIVLLYYSLSDRIGDKLYLPAVGVIGFCLISFIFFLRTLILDVNSVKFEGYDSNYDQSKVEIRGIHKIALEIISSISNFIIIIAIFIFGISQSKGDYSDILSKVFIVILLFPMLILLKSLIFDFNLIFLKRTKDDSFLRQLINRRTLAFIVIAIIIFLAAFSGNILVKSISNLYSKSISAGDDTISGLSSNLFITGINGERAKIPGAPITKLNIYIEAIGFDLNVNSLTAKYKGETNTSTMKFGSDADASHFSYEGKMTGKGGTILKIGDEGIITINLTLARQELYSNQKGTLQLIQGNGKTISKDFTSPGFKEDTLILLFKQE